MYAMNRQLKSLKLFIEIIEKGHSIEFEFNGNLYLVLLFKDDGCKLSLVHKNRKW